MARQLNLDRDKLDQCYEIAGHVIALAWKYIQRHSSKAIERATLLYLGVEGEYRGESLASRLVASLTKDQLRLGAAYWWGEALAAGGQDPKDLINRLIRGKVKWDDLPKTNPRQIRQLTEKKSGAGTAAPAPNFSFGLRLKEAKPKRLRHAAQDWLKKQEGMALLELASSKKFQDFWSEEEYREAWEPASARQTVLVLGGLNSPEQAVWAGAKNFYFLQPDGLNEILRKEMDTHRGLVDLSFVLTVCAQGGAKVLSPRLTGKPASWLAHLLLFEQLARRAGMEFENVVPVIGPHPEAKDFSEQIVWLQLLREMFPQSRLWLEFSAPPHSLDLWAAAFAEIDGLIFAQEKEVQKARAEWQKMAGLAQEFQLNTYGQIARQAQHLLDQTWKLLIKVQQMQLWKFLEGGTAGQEGVFQKSYHYWNPLWMC